ncbi:MAG: helix-turn-helix transcriptional regulator, partial [Roseburia sp.]|nr:helix-turn-helix transcriptional regulator [Roseburia sp.]
EYKKFCYDDNPHYRLHHTVETHPQHSVSTHLHYDSTLILTYFMKGSGNIRIEGQHYFIQPGDVILINPNELHCLSIDADTPHERIALYINDSILDSFDCGKHDFFDAFYKRENGTRNLITAESVDSFGIGEQLKKILKLTEESTTESTVLAICAIIELLAKLNQALETLPIDAITPMPGDKRIHEVIRYLNKNCEKELSVEMIAEQFHFSKYHLCRLFKEYVGTTLWEYLIYRRLLAFNQLVCQNYSLEEASYQVGFHNYSNFYRLYKKYMGITPTQYKQKMQQQK